MGRPFISICIPAYKRAHYLQRLLDSIAGQSFKDYEVIISDDSGDDNSVRGLVQKYDSAFALQYHRNTPALGTPRNWQAAVLHATGEWILLIHDDDWLAGPDSLERFAQYATGEAKVIFSGYKAHLERTDEYVDKTITQSTFRKILQDPYLLFAKNVLGPPSALMYHSSIPDFYELDLKWVVDLEFYIRLLLKEKAVYIDEPLISWSNNDTQVTHDCIRNPEVELPESLFMAQQYGKAIVGNKVLYNAWWRLIRNLNIRSVAEAEQFSGGYKIPPFLKQIIERQSRIPARLLQIGPVSMATMTASYLSARLS